MNDKQVHNNYINKQFESLGIDTMLVGVESPLAIKVHSVHGETKFIGISKEQAEAIKKILLK